MKSIKIDEYDADNGEVLYLELKYTNPEYAINRLKRIVLEMEE